MSRNEKFGQARAATPYQKLIYSIFQSARDKDGGVAIGLVSPEPGAGTSSLSHEFVAQLSAGANRILEVDLAYATQTVNSVEDMLSRIRDTAQAYAFEFKPPPTSVKQTPKSALWTGNAELRRSCVQVLQERFDYILFDCPALEVSGDALGIASAIDGFLLVIEADRTTTQQIQYAEESLEDAGAKLYGSILNKQRSPVPTWAQRLLGDSYA